MWEVKSDDILEAVSVSVEMKLIWVAHFPEDTIVFLRS